MTIIELKSTLIKYEPSNQLLGDSPEIHKLKILCLTKRNSEDTVSREEVKAAIASARELSTKLAR